MHFFIYVFKSQTSLIAFYTVLLPIVNTQPLFLILQLHSATPEIHYDNPYNSKSIVDSVSPRFSWCALCIYFVSCTHTFSQHNSELVPRTVTHATLCYFKTDLLHWPTLGSRRLIVCATYLQNVKTVTVRCQHVACIWLRLEWFKTWSYLGRTLVVNLSVTAAQLIAKCIWCVWLHKTDTKFKVNIKKVILATINGLLFVLVRSRW